MSILADIGGTHVRFAKEEGGALSDIRKYQAADFISFEAALGAYCSETGRENEGTLAIATAAYQDNNVWRFVNRNKWVLDPEALEKQGWPVRIILNDFEAATWGLNALTENDLEVLKPGQAEEISLPRCLMGPGTGLGLGFLFPLKDGGWHVQRTHGGHMLAASLSDEQHLIIDTIKRLREEETIVVFENLVSGPGLYLIYHACCLLSEKRPEAGSTKELLENPGGAETKDALRLFHEFLGLFAHMAVVTGHAYGGLYLTGGIIDRLMEKGLFDLESFEKHFILPGASSVTRDLDATKIALIKDPYLAMRGLLAAPDE